MNIILQFKSMVNSCVAINCTNRRVTGNGVKLHKKFPLENKELYLKWVAATTRDRFIPIDNSYLCGDHFIAADYNKYVDSIKLKDNVVPTIFKWPQYLMKTLIKRKSPIKRKFA